MNLFNDSIQKLATQNRSFAASTQPILGSLGGLINSSATSVNTKTSLKLSAFWCGINTITDSIALLPKQIYNKTEGKRTHLKEHPVDYVIHKEPNRCMTAFNFWKTISGTALLKGNGYAKIIRDGNGNLKELQLIPFEAVTVYLYQNELFYKVAGEKKLLLSDEVLHIPGFSFNGITGMGVVQAAAQNLGASLEAEKFAAQSFTDRGVSYGVIEIEGDVSKKGKENLANIVDHNLSDSRKHKVTVLDEGMRYKKIALSPAETQFIETKASGIEDIARWLKIPLHKLHTKGEGGYNFLVQMSIEYLQTAVMPLAHPIKEEIERKLLTKKEKQNGNFCFINYRKLLEADPKARAQYYKDLWFIRAINSNEIRELEDMNPYEGGNDFLQPANMLSELQLQNQANGETAN